MPKKENVLALDDLLAEYGQDIASFLGEASLDNHRAPDGKLYFIPTWQGLTSVNEGIAFPNELLQYVPDTWTSELEQAYRDFAKNSSTETTRAIIEKMEEYLAALKANVRCTWESTTFRISHSPTAIKILSGCGILTGPMTRSR